jgi:hypothetical protein
MHMLCQYLGDSEPGGFAAKHNIMRSFCEPAPRPRQPPVAALQVSTGDVKGLDQGSGGEWDHLFSSSVIGYGKGVEQ